MLLWHIYAMRKLILPLIALISLLSLVATPAAAQGQEITLKSVSVINQFPEGVRFKAEAETTAPAQIKEIKLDMKVKGSNRGSYTYLDFAPDASVSGEYLLKTTGAQYKPPGTLIEYRFIITDTEKRVLETPLKTHLYLDNRFEWSYVSDGLLEVYYYGPLKARAEQIARAGAQTIQNIGKLLDFQLADPVRIIAYNSPRDMIPAQPFESATTERELLLEGVTFPQYGTFLMIAGVERPDGVASHEMTHVIVGKLTENNFIDIPSWFSEGLAEYGNINPDSTFDTVLAEAISGRRLLPLRTLQSPPGIPDDRLLMYGQGKAVVKYMIGAYGEAKFRALFAAFSKGSRMDEALTSVYGFNQDGLDDAWRASIGLPPVEKAAAAQPPPAPASVPSEPAPVPKSRGGFNASATAAVVLVIIIGGALLISRARPKSG